MEKRRKIMVFGRWAVRGFALVGALIVIGVLAFIVRLDYFGRIAADKILANASYPMGREMPFTSGAIGYASSDIQIVGGMGQGLSCSLPPIVDWLAFPTKGEISPIGLRMRQACAYHDYCYRHGAATYGLTQADCDFALQTQAFRLCSFIEKEKRHDAYGYVQEGDCMRDARLVTLGVRVGGSELLPYSRHARRPRKWRSSPQRHEEEQFDFLRIRSLRNARNRVQDLSNRGRPSRSWIAQRCQGHLPLSNPSIRHARRRVPRTEKVRRLRTHSWASRLPSFYSFRGARGRRPIGCGLVRLVATSR